jgi:DNA-binding transcriptional MerR regulator
MPAYDGTVRYFLADFPRQLFPLDTNRIVIERSAKQLGQYIYERITPNSESSASFLSQTRAYSSKPKYHLRRTLKLDPIAEFFLYDLTYRHRTAFKGDISKRRRSFGYRFSKGKMESPARSFREFRRAVVETSEEFSFTVKADIAQYFNSLYHHDVVGWFRGIAKTTEDADFLGKFLRQINSGRSIDCLPHGIYPAKIIGSHFLKFVDSSNRLAAHTILRFMDDIYLFDNSATVLQQDFQQLQRLLGEKGLSVNAAKTLMADESEQDVVQEVDRIRTRLLEKRLVVVFGSGADEEAEEERDEDVGMEAADIRYCLDLLRRAHIDEEDAELVLAVMRDHSDDVMEHIPTLLRRFPSLIKNIFYFSAHVKDRSALLGVVRDFLRDSEVVSEFQLFWMAKICEEYLLKVQGVGDVMAGLIDHPSATTISKAKVLEIPEHRFAMPDRREEELRTGASGWLAWAAAIGSRSVGRATRNHLLAYFGNGGPVNRLIADCVKGI